MMKFFGGILYHNSPKKISENDEQNKNVKTQSTIRTAITIKIKKKINKKRFVKLNKQYKQVVVQRRTCLGFGGKTNPHNCIPKKLLIHTHTQTHKGTLRN